MSVDISVGTTIAVVNGEPATYDLGGFSALTYTEVGETLTIPEFGGAAEVAERTPLKTGVVDKRAGSRNYGDFTCQLTKDYADGGQAAIKAGFDGANAGNVHSFKIDTPGIGTVYFTGIISANKTAPGGANDYYGGSFVVNINGRDISTGDAAFFTLNYAAGANGTIIGPASQTVASGADGSAVYAAPNATFTFSTWSDANTDNPRTDLAVGADISVTATFV